jgi:hypothetical protein
MVNMDLSFCDYSGTGGMGHSESLRNYRLNQIKGSIKSTFRSILRCLLEERKILLSGQSAAHRFAFF